MDIPSCTSDLEEYKALSSHLANPENLEDTLARFTNSLRQACKSSLSEDELEDHLSDAADSILLLASQLKHDSAKQDELVKVVKTLIDQEPVKDSAGKAVEYSGSKVWADLPMFGRQVRERWNFPDTQEVDQDIKNKWINVNAFVARLTAASWKDASVKEDNGLKPKYPALEFSLYGIWSIRSALEEEPDNKGNTTDAQIGAAATWMLYAGAALESLCEQEKQFQGKYAKPGFRFKEKEWRGYSRERWQVWQKELAQAKSLVQEDNITLLVTNALESTKQ